MRKLGIVAVVTVCLLSLASPAGAHSTLLSGCPSPGDVLNEVVDLELTFGTPLLDDGDGKLDLLADNGQTEVDVGPIEFSEDLLTVRAAVLADLEPGRYIVRYFLTSSDGDDADGGFEFTYNPDADPDTEFCEVSDSGGAAGWVLLVVGVVAVGALAFFLRPKRDGEPASG